jgi:hypothetical protein
MASPGSARRGPARPGTARRGKVFMAPRQRSSRAALAAARNAFKGLDDDRRRFDRLGLGPGEAYRNLWRVCADDVEGRDLIRKKLANETLTAVERQRLLSRHDMLQERIRDTLRHILPYERPRLSAVEVSEDQLHPERVKPDLTRLSDAELKQLERIVLKIGGPATPDPDITK